MHKPIKANTPIAARIRLAGEFRLILGLTRTNYDGIGSSVAVKLLSDDGGFIPMQVHRDQVERVAGLEHNLRLMANIRAC